MDTEKLSNKQNRFASYVAKLIQFIQSQKIYTVGRMQILRSQTEAETNAINNTGIVNSLHLDGLAVDVPIFLNGVLLTKSEDYKLFGVYWKTLSRDCNWGGDFVKKDGNHFSVSYQGRK